MTLWTLILFFGIGPKDPMVTFPGYETEAVCQDVGGKMAVALQEEVKKKGLAKMLCVPVMTVPYPTPRIQWPWLTPPTKSIGEQIKAVNPDVFEDAAPVEVKSSTPTPSVPPVVSTAPKK